MRYAVCLHALVFGTALVFASITRADSGAQGISPDSVVDAFVELALKSEYSLRANPVRKWLGPIRYHVVHRVGEREQHEHLLKIHLAHLSRITGVPIAAAPSAAEANFVIVLTNDEHIDRDTLAFAGADKDGRREQFFRDSMCLASFRTDPSGAISRATALIPVDRARSRGELVACISEELTHVMGLSNDTDHPLPSIFNHGTVRSFLTGLDILVLRMLYDPRVKPGMKELELRPMLKRIAAEFGAAGLLDTADRHAAESGLAGSSP